MQASFEPTDLAALTADLASAFRSAIERAGLEFRVDCQPLAEPVYVDHDMWEKIVLNLLSNALKFTFEGEIAVLLREVDGRVELVVRDTGTGIPAGDLEKIFEKGITDSEEESSLGLGLAIVRTFVEAHGGKIVAQSKEGTGSVFLFTLPLRN